MIKLSDVTWRQLQRVEQLPLGEGDLAGYETARDLINRAVGGDRAAKERCVEILNRATRTRLRAIVRDFFKDKPPGTAIEQADLNDYHSRLREAVKEEEEL